MSFHALLKHRCTVRRLQETVVDGASSYGWTAVATNVRCYLDLQSLSGRDPYFTPEGGRPSQRAGRVFVEPTSDGGCPIAAGDSIIITRGPSGTFKIENILDEIWTPHRLSHYELGVTEVAPQIARAQVSN